MRTVILLTAYFIISAPPAVGVALTDLGIPTDPEITENSIYGVSLYTLNFRAGPGEGYAVITTIPKGEKLPVMAWVETPIPSFDLENVQPWIRTTYKKKKGWVCVFDSEDVLITGEGNCLFPLTVTADEITMTYGEGGDEEEIIIRRGEKLEYLHRDIGEAGSECTWKRFIVRYNDIEGSIISCKDYGDPNEEDEWFVSFEPNVLGLFIDQFDQDFEFDILEGDTMHCYKGPGFGYDLRSGQATVYDDDPGTTAFYPPGNIHFIDGEWALVSRHFPDFEGWAYIGTEDDPRLFLYRYFYNGGIPIATASECSQLEYDVGINMNLLKEVWPDDERYYLQLWQYHEGDTYGISMGNLTAYQPPDAEMPICTVPCDRILSRDGYEWTVRVFAFEIPRPFNPDEPFRWVVEYSYEHYEYGDLGNFQREILVEYEDGE